MANCLNTTERNRIRELIAVKEAQKEKAQTLLDTLLGEEVESYRFDSGEGSQQAKRRKLTEVKEIIDSLQQEIDALYRRLECGGLTVINVRRKINTWWRWKNLRID